MVHHNFMHHNRYAGYGYGVVVNYAFPVIGANVFDHNRHAIAATGYPTTSYEACHNLVLPGATSFSFDMHGGFDKGFWPDTAGSVVLIHHNLFLAGGVDGVGIRGEPIEHGRIDDNQFVHAPAHAAFPSAMWQRFYPAARTSSVSARVRPRRCRHRLPGVGPAGEALQCSRRLAPAQGVGAGDAVGRSVHRPTWYLSQSSPPGSFWSS
jgi:hypothetical protein